MKAIVKDGSNLAVQNVNRPQLQGDGDVIVQVMLAGLCRTDLYAAEGKLQTPEKLILGHEFAGLVMDAESDQFKAGDRVCVNPLLSCGRCSHCHKGAHGACAEAKFIGIDLDGCFAGYIIVPGSSIYKLPAAMPYLEAAYAEPVAASLAVFKAGISPSEKGVIFGSNRFSQLMQNIMRIYGFENVDLFDPVGQKGQLERSSYDYVIETVISTDIFGQLVDTVKPGGKIILKSRNYEALSFRMNEVIKKEPIFHLVNYGSFQESIDLLATGKLDVQNLVDGVYRLEQYDAVFAGSKASESLKPFFAPWD